MYNDYNNEQNRSDYEYHYSYRSDADGFQPTTPVPAAPRKKKRAMKIVAGVLCGTLLIGGGFGAGWYLQNRDSRGESQVMLSDRALTQVEAVSVTGSEKLTLPQIYQANKDSCVSINTTSLAGYNFFGQPVETPSAGSGFVLTADGYIVTNHHVISNATSVEVTLDNGKTYTAEIVGSDKDYDVAVLKVDPGEDKLTPVVLGSAETLVVGEDVCTIGNPLGELTFSLAEGVVSCLDREINLNGTPFNMIQTTAAVNPGNSGGPLFNSYGEVVGIVTAKTSTADSRGTAAEGLGFAIPIDDVLSMLKDIMENGQVTSHAYMGVIMEDVSRHAETGVRSGAYLVEVTENGPAAKAGLQAGDVITMLGTSTITSSSDLKSAVGSKSYVAGDTATVTFVRGGQVMTTELTFGSTIDKPQEPTPQSSTSEDRQVPDSNSGYDEYYGDMEDFFNQFFGRYGRAS